jgi:hypothetical protein
MGDRATIVAPAIISVQIACSGWERANSLCGCTGDTGSTPIASRFFPLTGACGGSHALQGYTPEEVHVIKPSRCPGFTEQTGGLTRGITLHTTQPAARNSPDHWLADLVDLLRRGDLAPATVRGYHYDLQQFT